MRSIHDFATVIKRAGKGAMIAADPVQILFGEVIRVAPLKIMVEQRLPLEEEQLILTREVRDHEVEMTVNHVTEEASGGSGEAAYASHSHPYQGRKTFLIHNGLVVGDIVKLLRVQGGQQYVVFDKE
ncbi:DUF2577 domain-containing protein [Sporosarcina sp. Te-1]|uniref:DUF2577 domain-containing protein n=1 Tax=Sporosarcina sp. Te-1 TaxID=2818390 RepID=UPI001A9DC52C|nr:DUF2577 domain-containing protein [Sporosarcina sp. Te-1]QTD40650.1 DUF2577 domain-containing protein [Sporosarcina sp. Te-1]